MAYCPSILTELREASRTAADLCRFCMQTLVHPGHPNPQTTGGTIPLPGGEGRDEGERILFPQGLELIHLPS
jgi:hypothetical protein